MVDAKAASSKDWAAEEHTTSSTEVGSRPSASVCGTPVSVHVWTTTQGSTLLVETLAPFRAGAGCAESADGEAGAMMDRFDDATRPSAALWRSVLGGRIGAARQLKSVDCEVCCAPFEKGPQTLFSSRAW